MKEIIIKTEVENDIPDPVLGLRQNLAQFSLLVLVNAFVGGMVGLERAILPLIAEREFGLVSKSVILSFIVGFGFVKAFTNLAAGRFSDRIGRKGLLVGGWTVGLPVVSAWSGPSSPSEDSPSFPASWWPSACPKPIA